MSKAKVRNFICKIFLIFANKIANKMIKKAG